MAPDRKEKDGGGRQGNGFFLFGRLLKKSFFDLVNPKGEKKNIYIYIYILILILFFA